MPRDYNGAFGIAGKRLQYLSWVSSDRKKAGACCHERALARIFHIAALTLEGRLPRWQGVSSGTRGFLAKMRMMRSAEPSGDLIIGHPAPP